MASRLIPPVTSLAKAYSGIWVTKAPTILRVSLVSGVRANFDCSGVDPLYWRRRILR